MDAQSTGLYLAFCMRKRLSDILITESQIVRIHSTLAPYNPHTPIDTSNKSLYRRVVALVRLFVD